MRPVIVYSLLCGILLGSALCPAVGGEPRHEVLRESSKQVGVRVSVNDYLISKNDELVTAPLELAPEVAHAGAPVLSTRESSVKNLKEVRPVRRTGPPVYATARQVNC